MPGLYKKKRRDKATGKVVKEDCWWIWWKDPQTGKRNAQKAFTDKEASRELLREKIKDAERQAVGLRTIDPTQQKRPLTETIKDYLAELVRRGSPAEGNHHRESRRILETLAKECKWPNLASIRPDGFNLFLAGMAAQGRAPRTQNRYHETLRSFLNWCVSPMNWLERSPLDGLKPTKVGEKGKRHRRRAFTTDELLALLKVAPEPRKTIYTVAALSGYRRNELAQMEKRDLDPTGERPHWKLRAEIDKTGTCQKIPIVPDLLPLARTLWEKLRSPTSRLFRAIPHIVLLHRDLKEAKIARQDAEGRRLDFHSFRYTFCRLMALRLPIQTVKVLMRHKTLKLTADLYGQLGLEDIGEAVWSLPSLVDLPKTESGSKG